MKKVPFAAAAAVFVLHLIGNPHYGFFRDELYFIICGFHPQFGYVDQPPVVPLLSALTQLFGPSLVLLRAIPALFAALGVYVTCLLAAEFGGGAFAQVLAALVVFFCSVLTNFGMKMSPDTIGLFTWPLIALLVVRIVKGADPRLWLWAGLAAGISLQSKYSVVFFLAALFAGLLFTPERRVFANRWFAAGAAVAAAIALPNFLWQWAAGFPMLELLQAGQNGKNIIVGPALYLAQEILITGLFLAVVWIAGLVWLLRTAQFRFLGFAYIALIAEMIVFHGKHYYPADVYPIVIAAGAIVLERWTEGRSVARSAVVAAVCAVGIAFLPLNLPILPENTFVSYLTSLSSTLHISKTATATEANRETSALPGDWADMHGWPEIAAAAARVYDTLPPAERARAAVFAGNYGEASAVAFFQPHVPIISEHNQYWLWGPRGYTGDVLVQVGGTCFHSDRLFASRTLVTRVHTPWAISYENDLPVWICRGIKKPIAQVWPSIKTFE